MSNENPPQDKKSLTVIKKLPPVIRNTRGLRNALFDEIDLLRSGQVSSMRANAVSKLAAEIINTLRTEMEYQRHTARFVDTKLDGRVVELGDANHKDAEEDGV